LGVSGRSAWVRSARGTCPEVTDSRPIVGVWIGARVSLATMEHTTWARGWSFACAVAVVAAAAAIAVPPSAIAGGSACDAAPAAARAVLQGGRAPAGAPWRYEMGLRVRAMERAFLAERDPAARARVVRDVENAVSGFFRGALADSANALDRARVRLADAHAAPHPAGVFAVHFAPRIGDVDTDIATLRIELLPGGDLSELGGASFQWRIAPGALALENFTVVAALPGTDWSRTPLSDPMALELRLPPMADASPSADVTVEFGFGSQDLGFFTGQRTFQRVPHLVDRLAALKTLLAASANRPALALERDTARGLLELIAGLCAGEATELDIDAAGELARAETFAAADARGERVLLPSASGSGDQCLYRGTSPARFFAPTGLDPSTPRPLVVALHGMGGCENLFFDGHGGGLVVELARQRGWMVLAPRLELFGKTDIAGWIDTVAERWPVDRDAVFLIGHSMGAAAALREARRAPERYGALALLGGGSAVEAGQELFAMPILIAAGARDFARSGASSLAHALARAGHPQTIHAVIPDCEHLLVVPLALRPAFALFDGAARARSTSGGH